jgi:hypothetical protein
LQQNSLYQISQGNISIWSTPWCSSWENIYDDLIIQDSHFIYLAKVQDLWIPQTKSWNVDLINSLFQRPTADAIKAITIIPYDEHGILCWKLTQMANVTQNLRTKLVCKRFLMQVIPSQSHQMTQHSTC